jgi:hypothetical protein
VNDEEEAPIVGEMEDEGLVLAEVMNEVVG